MSSGVSKSWSSGDRVSAARLADFVVWLVLNGLPPRES